MAWGRSGALSSRVAAPGRLLAQREDVSPVETPLGPLEDTEFAAVSTRFGSEFLFLGLAAMVGASTGLGVSLFKISVASLETCMYAPLASDAGQVGMMPAALPILQPGKYGADRLFAALVPALGGFVVSSLRTATDGFGGDLTDFAQQVERRRDFDTKGQLLKILAAVATLGTGNSLGPEGPAVEIGASCARLGGVESLALERQRRLLLCGCAAGVAAGFNAPLAGVFFSLEVAQEYIPTVGPQLRTGIAGVLLSSVVSSLTANLVLNEELALRPAPYDLDSVPAILPLFIGLGLAAGAVAIVFKTMLNTFPKFWDESDDGAASDPGLLGRIRRMPIELRPAAFGLLCGGLGLFFPQILFFGYDTLDGLIRSGGTSESTLFLLWILSLKAVMTAGSLASGLVGGTFAPALFLGATLGAAYQQITYSALRDIAAFLVPPEMVSQALSGDPTPAFAMVGAASVLAALFRAPLTSLLLLFELTRDYNIVVIAGASAGVASLLSEIWRQRNDARETGAGLESLVRDSGQRRFLPSEMGVSLVDDPTSALSKITVQEVMAKTPLTFFPDESIFEAIAAFEKRRETHALVVERTGGAQASAATQADVDRIGKLYGVLSVGDAARALDAGTPMKSSGKKNRGRSVGLDLERGAQSEAITVGDACTPRAASVTVRNLESARRAAELLDGEGLAAIAVVASDDPRMALGLVDRRSLLVGTILSELPTARPDPDPKNSLPR
eukprot:scaffold2679_cov251-Pinguiococcus_pyrenoidosus.AAC.31